MSPAGDGDGGQAGNAPSAKLSRKFSGSARFRVLIDRAQQALEEKNLAYREARAVREHLLRLLRMLDAATVDDAHITLLHQMALRSQSIPRPPALGPEEALTPSASFLPLDSLPTRLVDYDDSLLDRVTQLQLGDFVQLYRIWSGRVSTMVLHVGCHGDNSHFAKQFEDAVLQFAVFHTVHAWTMPHQQLQAGAMNMLTGQTEQPPDGWYERVAQQLPADKAFGQLVKSGIEFIHAYEDPAAASRVDHAKGIFDALKLGSDNASNVPSPEHFPLVEVEAAIDKYFRISSHIIRQRLMVTTYLFTNLWNRFGPSAMAQLMCNCWPYAVRGVVVFEAYLRRPEVAGLLAEGDGSATDAGAEAGPSSALVGAAAAQQGLQFHQSNAGGRHVPTVEERLERLERGPHASADMGAATAALTVAAAASAAAAAVRQWPPDPSGALGSALFPSSILNSNAAAGPSSHGAGLNGLGASAGMGAAAGAGTSRRSAWGSGDAAAAAAGPGASASAAGPGVTASATMGAGATAAARSGGAAAAATGPGATAKVAANPACEDVEHRPASEGLSGRGGGRSQACGSGGWAGPAADDKDRGERGDRAEKADKCDKGERGERGDRAALGKRGAASDWEERGDRVEKCERDDRGENGMGGTPPAGKSHSLPGMFGQQQPATSGAAAVSAPAPVDHPVPVPSGLGLGLHASAPAGGPSPVQSLRLGNAQQVGHLQLPLLHAHGPGGQISGGQHGLVTSSGMLVQSYALDLGGGGSGSRGPDGAQGFQGLTQTIDFGAHGGLMQLSLPPLTGSQLGSLLQLRGQGHGMAAPLMGSGHQGRMQGGPQVVVHHPNWQPGIRDLDALRAMQQQQQLPMALQLQLQQQQQLQQHQMQQQHQHQQLPPPPPPQHQQQHPHQLITASSFAGSTRPSAATLPGTLGNSSSATLTRLDDASRSGVMLLHNASMELQKREPGS